MERVHGTRKSPKSTPEDVISTMPEIVITNIMNRLPIRDAVRSSILSTNWRFKWTLLSRLKFDEKFFEDIVGTKGTNNYNLRNVIGFLLYLKGPITKFVLYLTRDMKIDVEDINHWLLFLSGKGIKEVILFNWHDTPLTLPTHLFSCLELKDLMLHNCSFHPPPSFHGFPNLLGLRLNFVSFESYKCGELITRCPLLQSLSIVNGILSGKVKPDEIAKLKNLKLLDLSLRHLELRSVTSFSIFQLVGSLPNLEEFNLDFEMCKFLAEAGARKHVPTSFPCLKRLQLLSINLGDDVMASYVYEMICCSPNLQTLDIDLLGSVNNPPTTLGSSDLGRNIIGNLQLQKVMFGGFRGLDNEVCLIKSLLACSPLLSMMRICLKSSITIGGGDKKNFMLAKKLLKLRRASPIAEIDII